MDKDGYPTQDELEQIATWDITKDRAISSLIDFIKDRWEFNTYIEYEHTDRFQRPLKVLELHTSGWSGNEDIISALRKNTVFWIMYWYSSKRGGHYEFRIPVKNASKT